MQFYARALQPLHPSHLIGTVTSPPNPHPLRATLQASYHSILRGLQVKSDNPITPSLIFGGMMLEEGAYPLARSLLRGRMIEEIIREHPTKCSCPFPLQFTQPNNYSPGFTEAPSPSSDLVIAGGSSLTASQ